LGFFNPNSEIKICDSAENKKPKVKTTRFVVKEKTKYEQNKISQSNLLVSDRK
jgi:hypothetical protein